jgi:hypothetical protein
VPSFRSHYFFPPLYHWVRSTPSLTCFFILKTIFLQLLRSSHIFVWWSALIGFC